MYNLNCAYACVPIIHRGAKEIIQELKGEEGAGTENGSLVWMWWQGKLEGSHPHRCKHLWARHAQCWLLAATSEE